MSMKKQSKFRLSRLPLKRHEWLMIVFIFLLVGWGIYQLLQQSARNIQTAPSLTAPTSTVSSSAIVLRFAGSPITAQQIDNAELAQVNILLHQNRYTGGSRERRQIEDRAFYSLFDSIEINKQLARYKVATVASLMKLVTPIQHVDSQMAFQFYQVHPALFARSAPRIHVREIIVKDAELARNLRNQLLSGASFVELAQKYSLDPAQYRDQGGDLGWIAPGQMPLEWDSVAFTLTPNEISDVFSVGSSYCILQVLGGPVYDVVPYKDVAAQVPLIASEYLQNQQFHKWLSMQVFQESILVLDQRYSLAVGHVLRDLQAHPDQDVSSL